MCVCVCVENENAPRHCSAWIDGRRHKPLPSAPCSQSQLGLDVSSFLQLQLKLVSFLRWNFGPFLSGVKWLSQELGCTQKNLLLLALSGSSQGSGDHFLCSQLMREVSPTPLGDEEERRVHRCPQRRKTFAPGPELEKNIMLAALVETLVKTGLHADHCCAGAEDAAFDFCTGRKLEEPPVSS